MNQKESHRHGLKVCEAVARELVWLRTQLDISQREMAQLGGLHWANVNRVEIGKTLPTLLHTCRSGLGLTLPAWQIVRAAETGDRTAYPENVAFLSHDRQTDQVHS